MNEDPVAASRIGRLFAWLVTSLDASAQHSACRALAGRIGIVWRASFGYRWLTAEPEPDVIVIDLRETVTVGPLLGVIDGLLSPFSGAWEHSSLSRLALAAGHIFTNSNVLVAVAQLLEPPPMPQERHEEEPTGNAELPEDEDAG